MPNHCLQFDSNLNKRLLSRLIPVKVMVVDFQNEVIQTKTLWNLFAYLGLQKFFI